jgi:hypothetical protein
MILRRSGPPRLGGPVVPSLISPSTSWPTPTLLPARARSDATFDDEEDEGVAIVDEQPVPRQNVSRVLGAQTGAARFPIPIFNGKTVVIERDFPLFEEDWSQFMMVLGVMKSALVIRLTEA